MKADIIVHIPPGWRRLKTGTLVRDVDRFLCQYHGTLDRLDGWLWEEFGTGVEENEDTALPDDVVIRKVVARGRRKGV